MLKPREPPVLHHSVPLARDLCRCGFTGTCQEVDNHFAGDGAARVDDKVCFGVRGTPDDVENVVKWEDTT